MTAAQGATDTVRVTIDGRQLDVAKQTLVIRAAEQLGITIPRFCDHPLLDPVAACRQCLVEVEGQRKPFTACSTQCTDGMVVGTHLTSEVAKQGQAGQLELLLVNHPLDCPQCDKGGECPLQDQALAHGPGESRFIDAKRRYTKPVPISAQVALDRERCVLCARCTRFSQEISGDPFIELFERGALEQVAIYTDEPYDSYFSGNVVQICPVGALTAASYRFASRPFDLRSTKGICNQCSAGCNLRVDVRRGEIQRQLAGEHMPVNEMWSCDKGRFGFEFVAHDDRLRHPLVRDDVANLVPATWDAALTRAAAGLRAALDAGGPSAVGVMTGGRLTDEDAYATSRFAREVLGTDNVDFRLRPRTEEERDVLAAVSGTLGPTYDDVEAADVVVVAGLDCEEEVPILYLRLRKAWRKRAQRLVVVGPVLGSLAGIAWSWIPTPSGGEGAVLDALSAPDESSGLDEVAEVVRGAERLVVLAGERLAGSPAGLTAAARMVTGHRDTKAPARSAAFAWVPRRNGARGAVDAGLLPGVLPGGRSLSEPGPVADAWNGLPDAPGLDTRGMLAAAARGELKALYLIGVDPARDFEDPALARAALAKVDTLIVQDLLPTETTRHADVILPAAAPQERVGSFTTWEGRRQPFPAAVPTQGLIQQDWDILRQLARHLGTDLGWETAMDVRTEAAPLMASPRSASEALLDVRTPATAVPAPSERDDELDAVLVDWLLGEGSMLLGAKELKATGRPPAVWVNPVDAERRGLGDGAAVTVEGPGGGIELPVRVTDGVVAGCVVVPANSTAAPGGVLNGTDDGTPAPLRVRLTGAGE
ncbi:MAG: NADH-quinone oxidoreductase subunit G [Euzebyales bacterium]|jgi:NADH-quinone oxidoreductase subunit G|nr:NADH-quinone oxidoreductase subunit G [Euzebyales bacterium]